MNKYSFKGKNTTYQTAHCVYMNFEASQILGLI